MKSPSFINFVSLAVWSGMRIGLVTGCLLALPLLFSAPQFLITTGVLYGITGAILGGVGGGLTGAFLYVVALLLRDRALSPERYRRIMVISATATAFVLSALWIISLAAQITLTPGDVLIGILVIVILSAGAGLIGRQLANRAIEPVISTNYPNKLSNTPETDV